MKPKIDIKSVISKAKSKEPNRVKVSFTLNGDVYREFSKLCEKQDIAMSRVLEELMIEANKALK